MYSRCPKCNNYQKQEYLGVSCNQPEYLKIFKCCDCEVFYTQKKIKGESNIKPQLLKKREINSMLKSRTPCVKCQTFKSGKKVERPPLDIKTHDYEYIYVVYMGKFHLMHGEVMNKFYCRNHKKSHVKQRYQFSKKEQKQEIIKLNKYIEESTSNYFYKELRKLYKDTDIKHAHKLEKYEKSFKISYDIGLPQTILAKIFHTSQSTINRHIKEKGFTRNRELYIESRHKATFPSRVKVDDKMINMNKEYWKRAIIKNT